MTESKHESHESASDSSPDPAYRVGLALLCDSANTDSAGRVNALGISDFVSARRYPMHLCTLTLVLQLDSTDSAELAAPPDEEIAGPGEYIPLSIGLLSEHGVPMGEPMKAQAVMPAARGASTTLVRLRMVHIPAAGRYFLEVVTDDRVLAKLRLEAKVEVAPEQ